MRRGAIVAALLFASSSLSSAVVTPITTMAASPQQGIDVSYWQGPDINWHQVAQSGISFTYIRAAEGSGYADPYFASNWSGALAAGVKPGAYLYFDPSQDPNAEADLLIQQLESVGFAQGMLTPAIDVETTANEPESTVVTNLQVVVNDLESAYGVAPVIYASPVWWDDNVGSANFVGDPLWVADWNSGPPALPANNWGGNGYQAWQYTSSGSVPGVSGNVDMDLGNPGPPIFNGVAPPVRGVALRSNGTSGYILDGYGNLHAFGGAPAESDSASWPHYDIARGIALRPDGQSGYVLDGYGGIHAFGGAPAVAAPAYWPGWDIARDIVLRPGGVGGYVLDGWGGIHPFGGAPPVSISAYWRGWDIARSLVLRADGQSGYVLDGYGGIHPFGGAPAVSISAYWPGFDIARSLVLAGGGGSMDFPANSGWVLDGYGGVHPFGGAPSVHFTGTAYYPGWDIVRGIAFDPAVNLGVVSNSLLVPESFSANIPPGRGVALHSGTGGYVLDGWGGITAFGGAPTVGGAPLWPGWDIARGIAMPAGGSGGYLLDGYGGVHPFGGAPAVSVTGYWAGQDRARALALRPDGTSGYVLDEYGQLWSFGGAPPVTTTTTWNTDYARGVALLSDGVSGYVLDESGALHAFGNASSINTGLDWSFDIARSVVMLTSTSGYILDGYGGVHAFGGAPAVTIGGYWPGDDIARGISLSPASTPANVQGVVITSSGVLAGFAG